MNSSEIYLYSTLTIEFFMVLTVIYFFIIAVIGWNKNQKQKEATHEPTKSFALIVCAHNEQSVISHIIESLQLLKYPKELYDIFVIADNCTDNTASIARAAGANVYERSNKVDVGKGFALRWMLDNIFNMERKYDAICVFDADNLVASNYLAKMNDMLCNGHQAIQAYLDIKNPYDSWVTLTNSIMYWITNRMFNQARHNLNMWCTIGGTGFCVTSEVLQRIPWDATCLAEDLEYTVKLVLNNVRVSWCGETAIFDEKPLTFLQSWNQRKRWMQGHVDVFSRFFIPLIKKGLKEKRLTPLDLALYNFQPINIVITFFVSVILSFFAMSFTPLSVEDVTHGGLLPTWVMYSLLFILNVMPIIAVYIFPVVVLIAEKRFNTKVLLGLFLWPIFGLSWVPIILLGIINKNNRDWNHTLHTREIKIDELEKV